VLPAREPEAFVVALARSVRAKWRIASSDERVSPSAPASPPARAAQRSWMARASPRPRCSSLSSARGPLRHPQD
jgi:hypothetical protein